MLKSLGRVAKKEGIVYKIPTGDSHKLGLVSQHLGLLVGAVLGLNHVHDFESVPLGRDTQRVQECLRQSRFFNVKTFSSFSLLLYYFCFFCIFANENCLQTRCQLGENGALFSVTLQTCSRTFVEDWLLSTAITYIDPLFFSGRTSSSCVTITSHDPIRSDPKTV